MKNKHLVLALSLPAAVLSLWAAWGSQTSTSTTEPRPFGAFAFRDSVDVPIGPVEAYDAFVDVDAWWDHRFSDRPAEFFIDARPGGGFFEVFDESGDGVLHAQVIAADRGKLLRLHGPLGLSGYAVDVVYTVEFEPFETGTIVRLDVRGAGELEDGWPGAIEGVWRHFLADRYKPYVEELPS